jgi:hypothetical protein
MQLYMYCFREATDHYHAPSYSQKLTVISSHHIQKLQNVLLNKIIAVSKDCDSFSRNKEEVSGCFMLFALNYIKHEVWQTLCCAIDGRPGS